MNREHPLPWWHDESEEPIPDWCTLDEAAKYLERHKGQISRHVSAGRIRTSGPRHCLRLWMNDVALLLVQQLRELFLRRFRRMRLADPGRQNLQRALALIDRVIAIEQRYAADHPPPPGGDAAG